ncbi:hypothetical protein SK128_008962 [Halocaridina rubra]|uniref:Uncharacterized protein n=1 Tax=Halocaridina rubra TaxID=373956 RepID=A0AAN8WUI1_HALRR
MEVVTNSPNIPEASVTNLEMYIKEVYDEPANMLSIEIRSRDNIQKYILDWNSQQMLDILYSKHDNSIRECIAKPLSDGTIFFPPIWGSGQNISISHIIGPGVLLGIMNWTEAQYKGKYKMRGMTTDRWDWCGLTELEDHEHTYNVSMATYWSGKISSYM